MELGLEGTISLVFTEVMVVKNLYKEYTKRTKGFRVRPFRDPVQTKRTFSKDKGSPFSRDTCGMSMIDKGRHSGFGLCDST